LIATLFNPQKMKKFEGIGQILNNKYYTKRLTSKAFIWDNLSPYQIPIFVSIAKKSCKNRTLCSVFYGICSPAFTVVSSFLICIQISTDGAKNNYIIEISAQDSMLSFYAFPQWGQPQPGRNPVIIRAWIKGNGHEKKTQSGVL
jgi:hypothetical protein